MDQSPAICKKVSFCEQARVKRTIHINDYASQEIQACWHSEADYERMERENEWTLDMIESGRGNVIDDVKFSRRGLEFRKEDRARMRSMNQLLAQDAVLSEQELQNSKGFSDPDVIAALYVECSYRCQEAAYLVGLADLRIARSYDRPVAAKTLTSHNTLVSPSTTSSKLRQLYSSAA